MNLQMLYREYCVVFRDVVITWVLSRLCEQYYYCHVLYYYRNNSNTQKTRTTILHCKIKYYYNQNTVKVQSTTFSPHKFKRSGALLTRWGYLRLCDNCAFAGTSELTSCESHDDETVSVTIGLSLFTGMYV